MKLEYWKEALSLYRGNLYDDLLDEACIMTYYHRYSSLYSEILIALLDELGRTEHYSEVNRFDKKCIIRYLGRVSKGQMRGIDDAVKVQLGYYIQEHARRNGIDHGGKEHG